MNLDVICAIIILAFFIQGYKKGILIAFFSFAALVIGLLLSLKLSKTCAWWMLQRGLAGGGASLLLSYIALFVGVGWVVRQLGSALSGLADVVMLGWADHLIGGALYGLVGVLICSTVLWVGSQTQLLSKDLLASSPAAMAMAAWAPRAFQQLGAWVPLLSQLFTDLETLFERLNQQIQSNVGTH